VTKKTIITSIASSDGRLFVLFDDVGTIPAWYGKQDDESTFDSERWLTDCISDVVECTIRELVLQDDLGNCHYYCVCRVNVSTNTVKLNRSGLHLRTAAQAVEHFSHSRLDYWAFQGHNIFSSEAEDVTAGESET